MKCSNPYVKDKLGVCKPRKNFKPISRNYRDKLTPFPCGQCLACRINRANIWTTRCILESKCWPDNCFVTLTYTDETLPRDFSIHKYDLRNFVKRLRYRLNGKKIRYYGVGEYGGSEGIGRPHYHIIIFGHDVYCKTRESIGCDYCKAETNCIFTECWTLGKVHVGEVNAMSARYISKYVTKGLYNYGKEDRDYVWKRLGHRNLEFSLMSRGDGGIGLPGIKIIADGLKKKGHANLPIEVIRTIGFNGRKLPLGRYLTYKLIELLGMEEQAAKEVIRYQDSVIDSIEGDSYYYSNMKDMWSGAIESQRKRFAIMNSKRRIHKL